MGREDSPAPGRPAVVASRHCAAASIAAARAPGCPRTAGKARLVKRQARRAVEFADRQFGDGGTGASDRLQKGCVLIDAGNADAAAHFQPKC